MGKNLLCFILFVTLAAGPLAVSAAEGEPPEWVRGQKTLLQEELKALDAHAAKVAGALKQAEQVVALAASVGDAAATGVANQAVELARGEKGRVTETMSRLRQMLGTLDAIPWGPRRDVKAVPVIVTGDVQRKTGGKWGEVGSAPISKGEEIRTGHNGRIDLMFEDGSRVHLGPNSSFIYTGTVYQLLKGKLHNLILPTPGAVRGEIIRHRTLTAVAAVRGTEFDLSVDEAGLTHLTPWSGTVELTADAEGIAKVALERWWDAAPLGTVSLSSAFPDAVSQGAPLSVGLAGGYAAVLSPGSELALAKEDDGVFTYVLKKGRVYVSRRGKGDGAKTPRFAVANATVKPADAAFTASLGGDGRGDIVPLAGVVEVKASARNGEAGKPFWKE